MYEKIGKQWNKRYVLYAKSHGRDPDAQLAQDEKDWPGGNMAGYILWIGERWGEWHKERGLPRDYPKGQEEHDDFDRWLDARIDKELR